MSVSTTKACHSNVEQELEPEAIHAGSVGFCNLLNRVFQIFIVSSCVEKFIINVAFVVNVLQGFKSISRSQEQGCFVLWRERNNFADLRKTKTFCLKLSE